MRTGYIWSGPRALNGIHKGAGAADRTLSSRLRSALERGLYDTGTPGAQVAVRRDGQTLWSACAGRLRLDRTRGEEPENVERNDRFVIASVTKLVVSCVTLSLVERGELDLEQTVDRWLPGLPNSDGITVRMLLGHGSGLREYFEDKLVRRRLKTNPLRHWDRQEILDAVYRLGPEAGPGERFAYRNTNYIVVGETLERCTGKRIGDLVRDHVSRPLGLETLSFSGEEPENPGGGRLASPYTWRPFGLSDPLRLTGGLVPSDAVGEVWSDGGVSASAEDVAALTDELFGGRLLRPRTVRELVTPLGYKKTLPAKALDLAISGADSDAYGLGVVVEQRGGRRLLGHDGLYLGWSSATTFEPRSRLTITALTNLVSPRVPARVLENRLRTALS